MLVVAAMPSCTQAERLPSLVQNNDGTQTVHNLAARQPRKADEPATGEHIISGSGSPYYKDAGSVVSSKGKGKGKGKGKHNHGKSMKEAKASKGPKSMKESKSPKGTKGPKAGKLAALEAKQSKATVHVAGAGVALVAMVGLVALVATKLHASAATSGCVDEQTSLLANDASEYAGAGVWNPKIAV